MPYLNPLTLADLRERVQNRWEGHPFWDNDDANDAINETLVWWNLLTGVWRRRETINLTKLTRDYALSASLTYPMRVQLGTRPLVPASFFGLDYAKQGWRGQRIGTAGVPSRVEAWLPISLMEIGIWPMPVDDTQLGTLTIDGVADTPILVADGDELQISSDWLTPMLGMALHLAAYKVGGARWHATKPLRSAFLAAALDQNERLTISQLLRTYAGLETSRLLRPVGGMGQTAPAQPPNVTDSSQAAS